MNDYNQQIDIAKKVMVEDSDTLSKLHNTKSIQQLCIEYPHLDVYIHQLQLKIKNYEQGTSSIYSPNKPTYKELEDKLALAENSKETAIDDLYETKIGPLQNKIKDQQTQLESTYKRETKYQQNIKELEKTITDQNSVIDYVVGYLSACEQFRDKHPLTIKSWFFSGWKDDLCK